MFRSLETSPTEYLERRASRVPWITSEKEPLLGLADAILANPPSVALGKQRRGTFGFVRGARNELLVGWLP